MPDNQTKKRPQDPNRINTNEQSELQYWAERFGTTTDRVRQAVQKVGPSPQAVEREIKQVA